MQTIVVKTQAEWDALPSSFKVQTCVEIRSDAGVWLQVKTTPESSRVEAYGSSLVVAYGSSRVVAWGSSRVVAHESSLVVAHESSLVVAWGSSRVVAHESSLVVAHESSRVVAHESSRVEAHESSRVEAWGSSRVEAYGSSLVVAHESSSVVAHESSRVEAWGSVAVHVQSDSAAISLFAYAVAILLVATSKVIQKSKTSTIVQTHKPVNTDSWLEWHGFASQLASVVVFKRVSSDWLTQEGTANQTAWVPGTVVEHARWAPDSGECGAGKYHAVARPFFADEFRNIEGDRYVAIAVARDDLFAWPNAQYPHKIAFRKCTVLYECDYYGTKVGV